MEWLGLSGVMASFLGLTLAIYGIFINGRNTKRLLVEQAQNTQRVIGEQAQNTQKVIVEQAQNTQRILERIADLIASEGEKTRSEMHRGKG